MHEAERGRRSWAPTIDGLVWLARNGFAIDVAGRRFSGEPEQDLRAGFARLFAELDLPVDADDPVQADAVPGNGRATRRAGDHHRLLEHPAQVARLT